MVNGIAPGFVTDRRISCPVSWFARHFLILAIPVLTFTSYNYYICSIFRVLHVCNEQGFVGSFLNDALLQRVSLCSALFFLNRTAVFELYFLYIFDVQPESSAAQNVLATVGATQVPLEGKQRRGLLEGMIIEWNRDWIGSSCHCQTHWQVDDSSPQAPRVWLVRRKQPVWMALCLLPLNFPALHKWVITTHGQSFFFSV